MSDISLVEREKRLLRELASAAKECVDSAASDAATSGANRRAAEAEHDRIVADIEKAFRADIQRAANDFQARQTAVAHRRGAQRRSIERECDTTLAQTMREIELAEQKAAQAFKEARWLARTVFEAKSKRLAERVEQADKHFRARRQAIDALADDAAHWLTQVGQQRVVERIANSSPAPCIDDSEDSAPGTSIDDNCDRPDDAANAADAQQRLVATSETAEAAVKRLKNEWKLKLARGPVLAGAYLLAAVIAAPAARAMLGTESPAWLAATAIVAGVLGTATVVWLIIAARRRAADVYAEIVASISAAQTACQACLVHAEREAKHRKLELKETRAAEERHAAEAHDPIAAECQRRRDIELPQIAAEADQRLKRVDRETEEELSQAAARRASQEADAHERRDAALATAELMNAQTQAALQANCDRAAADRDARWRAALDAAHREIEAIGAAMHPATPAWNDVATGKWRPASSAPPAAPFGRLHVNLADLCGADVARRIAGAGDESFDLPAVLDFPDAASVYIKAQDRGRAAAISLLQTVMLRMLAAAPPGKVRFTIFDPVGLGQNFASFMHLADYDEALVSHRIWTEPAHIEQRLADLTEHMETVIQKYLRNEFASIQQYNELAGEIAEPFRVLVVANFPAGFTESAARRLLSIAASGPRCGVHVLLSADVRLPPVKGVDTSDLQRTATIFSATNQGLVWHDPDFKDLPLDVESWPEDESKAALQAIGEAALAAKRVEAPFEAIAPAPGDYWQCDSRRGVDVPLGRAGATRLQHLRLGEGTSQHVLIAGKTGSGKSTLLHALITNAALRYSPAELELYLIDFKKGVEFKAYVTQRLPHARVVAIESEREFGLSVMQRLDAEMRRRGEMFRDLGVQDIAGYRDAGRTLPRVLFIVDEFQEFFVQDDKLAQEASLLLDRLVRQGRAFGIHVHLGSQTLSGAYSLARSTLGQMAVRIALQCSESDAHVILSEDNSAARLLSRPGEAIYNDSNGAIEGNHLFQVVWLPDDRRELYLREIARLAAERPDVPRPQQIVFEGANPAEIEQSDRVRDAVAGAIAEAAPRIWLGEPLAIEETTSAPLARQTGANVLMIGQNEAAVAGMMVSSLLSAAAHAAPSTTADESPRISLVHGGQLEGDLAAAVGKITSELGGIVRVASAADAPAIIAELAAEVERRQTSDAEGPALFLFVHDLARCRSLRRSEDEFSFSRSGDAERPRTDRQFAAILRDGPGVGVHVVAWCDTLTNFNRTLERHALREFDTRVLVQMNASDSSLLTETPAASQLGRSRALLHREDEGRLEKFRPFATPTEKWLTATCAAIRSRTSSANEDAPAETSC